MALKRKITKEEYEALPEVLKAEYKGDGASYVLDTDDDNEAVEALRRALENSRNDTAAERTAKKELKERLDEIDRRIRSGELTEAEANKDVEKLKLLFENEREALRTELTGRITVRETQIQRLLLSGRAESMARELAGDKYRLLLPHISNRLTVDMTGDEPKLSVLTSDGLPSTLTVEDLKKEFLHDADFASILVGVKSSGGGAGGTTSGGGATKKPDDYTEAERSELFRTNRAEFDKLFGKPA